MTIERFSTHVCGVIGLVFAGVAVADVTYQVLPRWGCWLWGFLGGLNLGVWLADRIAERQDRWVEAWRWRAEEAMQLLRTTGVEHMRLHAELLEENKELGRENEDLRERLGLPQKE